MFDIGFRAHDFGMHPSAADLAHQIAGFAKPTFVHLALKRCVEDARDPKDYDTTYAAQIRSAMEKEGVRIAILGCHINPIHPDPEARKLDLERFSISLRMAPAFGCKIVSSESGSAKGDCSYTPETYEPTYFDELVQSTATLVEAAEKADTIACYEGGQHTLNTFSRIERILKEFPSPHFGLLFDPVNLVPPTGIPEPDGSVRWKPSAEAQKRFIGDALDRFADRIVAVHVKDYRMQEDGLRTGGMPAGKGVLDWALVFRMCEEYGIHASMTLENCGPIDAPAALAYLSACQR